MTLAELPREAAEDLAESWWIGDADALLALVYRQHTGQGSRD